MIKYVIPYDLNKNIGKAYNEVFIGLNEKDFVCFLDGDARFTTPNWGHQIQKVLDDNPQVRYATCKTNRVNCKWQLERDLWDENNCDIHRDIIKENYKGIVWCPSTPNGTFIARRNGTIFLTGNTLRHGFANFMVNEKNIPLPMLQSMLGHSRLDTTGIYVKSNPIQAINTAWEVF